MPVDARIVVITPDLTKTWNLNLDNGTGAYYTYYGFNETGLVNFGQWINSVNAHIKELNAIISYYEAEIERRNSQSKDEKKD